MPFQPLSLLPPASEHRIKDSCLSSMWSGALQLNQQYVASAITMNFIMGEDRNPDKSIAPFITKDRTHFFCDGA